MEMEGVSEFNRAENPARHTWQKPPCCQVVRQGLHRNGLYSRSSAARLSVWLPARGGGQKAKVTGGGSKASSDSEVRAMRTNEEVFLILGSGVEAGASDSDLSPVGGEAARARRGIKGR